MAAMGHVLEETFFAKLPSSKDMELDESIPERKQWVKYGRPNAQAGAVILLAQESEDVILALQEANELTFTWPSRTAPDNSNRMMDFLTCKWRKNSMLSSSTVRTAIYQKGP